MIEQIVFATLGVWSVSCVLGFCFLVSENTPSEPSFHRIWSRSDS